MEDLKNLLNKLTHVSDEEFKKLLSVTHLVNFKSGEHIVEIGNKVDRFFFIKKGLVRIFYLDHEGNEFTKSFQTDGDILGPYAEIIQSIPSEVNIECLEDVETISIPYSFLLEAYDRDPAWMKLGLKILEKYFIEKEQRLLEFLKLSATQRYEKFTQQYAHLSHRIPKYHLASYLGIKPESLSRILKSYRK
jgi:CRP-like cAMP-binding protein